MAQQLKAIAELFPFLNTTDEDKEKHVKDKARCRKTVVALAAARSAEQAGLEALAKVK